MPQLDPQPTLASSAALADVPAANAPAPPVPRAHPAPRKSEDGRMPQLDALRTFAVLAVIVSHTLSFPGHMSGTYGVTLFFVLSGFLITGILLQCRDQALTHKQPRSHLLKQFYIRRFLRIFPLYYLVLSIFWLAGYPPVRDNALWFFGYLANFKVADPAIWPSSVTHFWSLAVEEQFYLLWPCLVLWTPPRLLPWITAAMIATGPTFRGFGAAAGMTQQELWVSPFSCLDALGLGALLAIAAKDGWIHRLRTFTLIAGLLATLLLAIARLRFPAAAPALWSLGPALLSAWLVASAAKGFKGPLGRFLSWAPLLWIGAICYGIYIYHMPIIMLLQNAGFDQHNLLFFLIVSALAIATAALSWYAFERPINNLKRYFPYVPASSSRPSGSSPP